MKRDKQRTVGIGERKEVKVELVHDSFGIWVGFIARENRVCDVLSNLCVYHFSERRTQTRSTKIKGVSTIVAIHSRA